MTTFTLKPQVAFSLLDQHPESIVYYAPLWNGTGEGKQLTDFEVVYCNQHAATLTRVTAEELSGQRVSTMVNTDEKTRQLMLQQLKQVYLSGEPLEYIYFNPVLEKYFSILRTKTDDGVLTMARDRTRQLREQEEKDRETALTNSILDTSINAIFACEAVRNEQGQVVDLEMKRINRAFVRLTGLSDEQVVGKRYLQLFPTAKDTGTFAMNCEVIETGKSQRREVYYKDEKLDAWYDVSLSKLGRDGLLVSFADITEQKKAFLQLAQQKSLLDNILQHSANGISVTEVIRNTEGKVIDGRTILANDAAVNFTGLPKELYLGKTAVELEPNILASPYFQLCLKTLDTGEPQLSRYFLESTHRWLEISISKMDEERLITIFTDITPEKESQLKQEQMLAELQRSNESLEEFTRAASHDLKEPIRKVQFFTEKLKTTLDGRLSEEEKSMMERMEHAAERMKMLVDDLLEYSHVNAQPATALEEIDLNKKLKLVMGDLELMITEKKARFNIGSLPVIRGHRRQIQQLLHNLLNNAVKYSKPGEQPVITISAGETTGAASGLTVAAADEAKPFHLIEIRDNGIGFEQADADRIFNVFTRLHGNSEYTGTGVGLAIVRKVVENHHGYIAAESQPGVGTTFRILLPA